MGTPRQVGALPIRRRGNGSLEVLLVTTRETRRWVIPKGWPSKRLSDRKAALREAEEEAGISGDIAKAPLGHYSYFKRNPDGFQLVDVGVYLLEVKHEYAVWAEQNDRQRAWLTVEDAAAAVTEPGLKTIIAGLDGMKPAAAKPRKKKGLRAALKLRNGKEKAKPKKVLKAKKAERKMAAKAAKAARKTAVKAGRDKAGPDRAGPDRAGARGKA